MVTKIKLYMQLSNGRVVKISPRWWWTHASFDVLPSDKNRSFLGMSRIRVREAALPGGDWSWTIAGPRVEKPTNSPQGADYARTRENFFKDFAGLRSLRRTDEGTIQFVFAGDQLVEIL